MAKAGVNQKPMPFPNSRVSKATPYGSKTVKDFPAKKSRAGGVPK